MNMRIIKALQDFKIGIVLLAAATTVAADSENAGLSDRYQRGPLQRRAPNGTVA
jgi:hypothetical protein